MATMDPERRLKILGRWFHAVGLGVTFATVVGVYALVFHPLGQQTAEIESQAEAVEGLLAGAEQVQEEHRRLSQSVSAMESVAATIAQRIPAEPNEAEFLAQLTEAAAQAGLQIKDYRPGQLRTRPTHSQIEIQLSCAGPYAALCRFLERVSRLPRLARVVRMEISAAEAASTAATIHLVIYCRLTRAKATGEPPSAPASSSALPRRGFGPPLFPIASAAAQGISSHG